MVAAWRLIQELARKHAPEAIETLVDIAKKGTPGARVSAAIALLDRAYGKPPQFNTSDATSFREAVDMSDDELAAIAARAKFTFSTASICIILYPCIPPRWRQR